MYYYIIVYNMLISILLACRQYLQYDCHSYIYILMTVLFNRSRASCIKYFLNSLDVNGKIMRKKI